MECNELSAEQAEVVKMAIDICNRPEIKNEILCTPVSAYDKIKSVYEYDNKIKWNETIEEKTTEIVETLGLTKQMQKKVIGTVLLAGMRMLTWAKYHEWNVGFSRAYSFNFLNATFFTPRGIIDDKKAADELMMDDSLDTKQKFRLACIYCYADSIPDLYRQLTKEDKAEFKKFHDAESLRKWKQPELVKFWWSYLTNAIDELKGGQSLDEYRLSKAVESGSKAAVKYCLERTTFSKKKGASGLAIKDAAADAIQCRMNAGPYTEKDWVIFREPVHKNRDESWVPSDYYVDILCLLLSKMGKELELVFLKQDIHGLTYETKDTFEDRHRSRVLQYFLNWPYQDYFMEKAKLMWRFLPERDYAVLVLRICDKIKLRRLGCLKYGELKNYDYRKLLREFWSESPDRFKRYVFSNQQVKCITGRALITTSAVGILVILLTLKKFRNEDEENIKFILASATGAEKEDIFSSAEWLKFCHDEMEFEKYEKLDRFVKICILSKEEEVKFKKALYFSKGLQLICINFVTDDKWEAAETLIKWSSLPDEDINKLKKRIIYSKMGMRLCVNLLSPERKLEAVDKFIRWCFTSEEDAKAFRKELVFSDLVIGKYATLAEGDQLELVGEFFNSCLTSEEDVKEIKKKAAYTFGSSVCERLISDYTEESIYDKGGYLVIGRKVIFNGGKWGEVENFLSWCFSSEEDIHNFKENKLHKVFGKKIHFKLVEANQWEEAEKFFTWLRLSDEEIKKLKRDTLFQLPAAAELFNTLMYSKEPDEEIVGYRSKQETIARLLKWFLTDKETALEFRDLFKSQYQESSDEADTIVLNNFDSKIEELLRGLDEEQTGVKRKAETSFQSKRLCK